MRLLGMGLTKEEIIAHIIFESKIISISVNPRNEASFLAEGEIDSFDHRALLQIISLSSPMTFLFTAPTEFIDTSYKGLLKAYELMKAVQGS